METLTWALTTGCTNIGSGCDSCPSLWEYRERNMDYTLVMHRSQLPVPLANSYPTNYIVCLGSDLFHEGVTNEFIRQAFSIMNECPEHKFEITTKRIERALLFSDSLKWTDNISIGVTVESSEYKWRIDYLKDVPSPNKFISFAPLLGPMGKLDLSGIKSAGAVKEEWGLNRFCDSKWIDEIKKQCLDQGVKWLPNFNIYTQKQEV